MINKKPLLSFCIPTLNRGYIVENCVQHILQYKGDDIEIIVCDSASTDDTKERLKRINDDRLKYYDNGEIYGLAINMRKALELANGEYACWLSDEDLVEIENIDSIKTDIKKFPTVGVFYYSHLFEGTPSRMLENKYYNNKHDSMLDLVYKYGYISGKIYNLNYYYNWKLDKQNWHEVDKICPNEYLCLIFCYNSDVYSSSTMILNQGNYRVKAISVPGAETHLLPELSLEMLKTRWGAIYNFIDEIELKEKLMIESFKWCLPAFSLFKHADEFALPKHIVHPDRKLSNRAIYNKYYFILLKYLQANYSLTNTFYKQLNYVRKRTIIIYPIFQIFPKDLYVKLRKSFLFTSVKRIIFFFDKLSTNNI